MVSFVCYECQAVDTCNPAVCYVYYVMISWHNRYLVVAITAMPTLPGSQEASV